MTDANMICPKCKTFQPRAETCRECGIIVAKMWTQHSEREEPRQRTTESAGIDRRSLLGGVGVLVLVAAGFGAWMLGDSEEGAQQEEPRFGSISSYLEAAQEAQRAADRTRERMEAANYEAETGFPLYSTSDYVDSDAIGLDLDRLAAELNAVSTVNTVQLAGNDLRKVAKQCAPFTRKYFASLRFGAKESYPIPVPETQFVESDALEGRFRCEGSRGTVYLPSAPRAQDGVTECWAKQKAPRERSSRRTSGKSPDVWVRMKWDEEMSRWSIYTRDDQRTVDRARMANARRQFEQDIDKKYASRADKARERIPELIAKIEDAREKLRIVASEAMRQKHTRSLSRYTRELKAALVERRFTQVCKAAAGATLDAREAKL